MDIDKEYCSAQYCVKLLHPKLAKILEKYKSPSPIKVVSDEYQPLSGDLKNMPKPKVPEIEDEMMTLRGFKRSVTLNLDSNRMMTRRNNKVS